MLPAGFSQVSFRLLSGCSQVALGVREDCCATVALKPSKAGLGMRSTWFQVKGCSDTALRSLRSGAEVVLRLP